MENIKYYTEDADEVAKYIMSKVDVTQKKLHKLLYFSYIMFLTDFNTNSEDIQNVMFKNSFQAWVHGPVLREIYSKYAEFGYHQFNLEAFEGNLPTEITDVCDEIIDFLGHLEGNDLENLSHDDFAWKIKRSGLGKFQPSNDLLELTDMYNSSLSRFYE